MHRFAFALVIAAGLVLAAVGFALSAPLGPTAGPEYSNPRLDFAPTIFVLGVILSFSSAVVYELTGRD
jgi:hypothetical protein